MKKLMPLMLALLMVLSFAYADIQAPGPAERSADMHQGRIKEPSRAVPYHYISRSPVPIMTSYYDYMVGSYNSLPLCLIPDEHGGGYFMVYQGRRDLESPRRVFFTHLTEWGLPTINKEISQVQLHEGFPTLVVDPVSSKPLYAWHANSDDDPQLEVHFVADTFIGGLPGLFQNYQIIVDNPTEITAPDGTMTTDNNFIWPTAVIGPSPVTGKRRVYVSVRNEVSHTTDYIPSPNALIAYTDFDGTMIENGELPTWSYTSVPTYDLWNVDTTTQRRPFSTLCTDNAGNIYYIGYHTTHNLDGEPIDEPDMHVLKCDNYGEGTWTTYTASSHIPAWIPDPPPWGEPYFVDENGYPFIPGELYWAIHNSSHVNAVVDPIGRIHFPALWGLTANDGTYFPNMQYLKQIVFDTARNEFSIHEVYPVKEINNFADYDYYHPWDTEPPWGEAEYTWIDGKCCLDIETMWPFCHWDETAHDGFMMANYNHVKMSKPGYNGMTVMVWQDSNKARSYNYYDDVDYADYAEAPDIMIAVSVDNGFTWKEPVRLNSVDYPQLAGTTPMWVYPADQVIYAGVENGWHMGRIGLLFYDDFTWGSNAVTPSYHDLNDGGQIMLMEVNCAFWPADDEDDPMADAPGINILEGNYPNPFNPTTTISYNMPASGDVKLNVYNLRGQLVRTLVNEPKTGGNHKVVWDGKDDRGNTMASGIYLYRLETGKHSETRKMMLMK